MMMTMMVALADVDVWWPLGRLNIAVSKQHATRGDRDDAMMMMIAMTMGANDDDDDDVDQCVHERHAGSFMQYC